MKFRLFSIAVFLLCFVPRALFCQTQEQNSIPPDSTIAVLFVGNSLTYTNDLPLLVTHEAKNNGISVATRMLAYPNYSLEDHWQDGGLQKIFNSEKFDFVVVQQGPSSQLDGKEMLLKYGSKIKKLCDKQNAKLVFFMVWPAKDNWHTFPGVIANYSTAAAVTQSILCPVGLEWKRYIESKGDYSYYGPDQFHPSLSGSLAAAKVIVETLKENITK